MSTGLRELLTSILPTNRFYAAKFAGVHPTTLADLPFTTKAELLDDQKAHPPYGSNLTFPLAHYCRMHQTSGTTTGQPLRWLDTPESWNAMLETWRRMFALMEMRRDDRLFFPFSFGPFLGFWTAFDFATREGYFTLPGGGISSAARLRFLLDHRITVVFCTPTYALHLAQVALDEQIELANSEVRLIVVAGEPGGAIPETRQRIESAWGARVVDHCGMTEVGPTAIECAGRPGGLLVMDEFIAEVIDPESTVRKPDGETGELVLTNLHRVGSPLIRYRTGDLVKLQRDADGRAWLAGGILGRIDDMIHLRGNNVYPAAIEAVLRRFPAIVEFRIVVDETSSLANLRIEIECVPSAESSIVINDVASALRNELLFRADVIAAPPGSLPRYEMKARRIVRVK